MRVIERGIIGVLILIGLAGCASLVQPGASPLESPILTGIVLQYQREGGIGGFDEIWTFEATGRVTHTGRGPGTDRQLTPDQVAQLIGALRAVNQADLKASYIPANTCCDRFTHTLTIALDGVTRTVTTLDAAPGEPGEPPALTALLATLTGLLK
ncbi:MAG: hypothetical protein HY870_24980 [Chloroflexi bacterium]|nr:hypothetical protein [Chloroflexota bacterium]